MPLNPSTIPSAITLTLALIAFTPLVAQAAGDPAAGKAASVICAACHGPAGISISPDFPHLAAQVPGYTAAQLAKYKAGTRQNPIMAGLVIPLTPQTMADLDAYYSSQPAPEGSITPDQEEAAQAGGKIYRGGYQPYNIAACMSCHGPSGHGIPPTFPRLSGQHAPYLEAQLLAFKAGTRQDPIMNPIAFALSAQQIKQLALYISALY